MDPTLLAALRARVDGTRGTALIEAVPALAYGRTGKLNRETKTIEDTVLITATSSNGQHHKRKYSPRALRQIASMAEGLPAYANHVAPDLAFKPRDVRDLIGRHTNVRYEEATGRVVSDLVLVDHAADWVFSLAERLGDHVGNSLVSKGQVRMEGDTEVVDEIVALLSGDLVSDPASTRGLFEGVDGTDIKKLAEVCGDDGAHDLAEALGMGWTLADSGVHRHPELGEIRLVRGSWAHRDRDGKLRRQGTGLSALRAYLKTLRRSGGGDVGGNPAAVEESLHEAAARIFRGQKLVELPPGVHEQAVGRSSEVLPAGLHERAVYGRTDDLDLEPAYQIIRERYGIREDRDILRERLRALVTR